MSRLELTTQAASRAGTNRLVAVGLVALAAWQAVDVIQAHIALSLTWAVLDEVAHGAVAGLAMLWIQPRWGWRPVVLAMLAGTLIDVDHAIAAGSLGPIQMMSLPARPISHSLLAALVAGGFSSALGGPRAGVAVTVGIVAHLLRDAQESPGVPLLIPLVDNSHVFLPVWVLLVFLAALAVTFVAGDRLFPRHR